jgi:holliday junction DNA helicase RuvA
MIAHLRGRILAKHPGQVIVEAAGVGYDVTISIPTFTALPAEGAEAALHIHTQVREDLLALFGFIEIAEKRLFERLITVSGVGPKLAVTILSGLSPDTTVAAIRGQDHAMLTRIPGVGKKTAERVTLELKDKLEQLAAGAPIVSAATGGATGGDVLSALENLGYPRPAAEKAVAKVLEQDPHAGDLEFEALFRAAMAAVR